MVKVAMVREGYMVIVESDRNRLDKNEDLRNGDICIAIPSNNIAGMGRFVQNCMPFSAGMAIDNYGILLGHKWKSLGRRNDAATQRCIFCF